MNFIGNNKPKKRAVHHLPRQGQPPNFKQLLDMERWCRNNYGGTIELTFGEAPEAYLVVASALVKKSALQWSLYRIDGDSSSMIWNQPTQDLGLIHHLINAQFPGSELRPQAMRPSSQGSENVRSSKGEAIGRKLEPTLQGDISAYQIAVAVQSIATSKATGRLELSSKKESASIMFVEGEPINSICRGQEGEAAFLELLTWEEGEFSFFPSLRQGRRTIHRRLDTLLLKASETRDLNEALKGQGCHSTVYPVRLDSGLSLSKLRETFAALPGADATMVERIYLESNGSIRLVNLIRKLRLTKAQWVPIFYYLAGKNLIRFSQLGRSRISAVRNGPPSGDNKVGQARTALLRADTGIFSYSSLFYFLKLELARWERFGRPFSIILVKMTANDGNSRDSELLTTEELIEIGKRIGAVKRNTDILAHYETFGLALLLPETDYQTALFAADRILDVIGGTLNCGRRMVSIAANLGVACIPDDGSTLGALLTRAKLRFVLDSIKTHEGRTIAAMDDTRDLVCTTDSHLTILDVSESFLDLLGLEREELLGRQLSSILAPEDVHSSIKRIYDLMSAGSTTIGKSLENRLQRKDGSTTHVHWSIRWNQETSLLQCVGHDVTAHKELDHLKDLVRMVAHDLSSPAMAVEGFLEAIEMDMGDSDVGGWRNMHKAAYAASSRLIRLVNDLLTFEQLGDSMLSLNYSTVPVSDILARALASTVKRDVLIEANEIEAVLQCDGDRIVQVVVNLLNNAVKFSKPGSKVLLNAVNTVDTIDISVTDFGFGIASESLEKIFLPFRQEKSEGQAAPKSGFGLGLAISKSLVELHGGTISVASTLGVGSTFTARLPKIPPLRRS